MSDREKVIKGLECCNSTSCQKCPYNEKKECNERGFFYSQAIEDAIALLKEQENLKQKMWNALYAEEDYFENKYVRTVEHDNWFIVYRSWLQRGFEIAINVIAEQDGM